MAIIQLVSKDPDAKLKTMSVETNRVNWPRVFPGGADISKFHGIGQLRQTGYDVGPLQSLRVAAVHQID